MTSDSPPDSLSESRKLPLPAERVAGADAKAELHLQAAGPLRVVEAVRRLDDVARLDGYQSEMVTVVGRMLADGVDVLKVTQMVAQVNDTLTTRLLHLAETQLGQPPCPYAWLALGSQGRGEQVLTSDQDSALAFDQSAQAAGAEYFQRLAGLVVTALARAGLPLCDGGFMATTWCHSFSDFRGFFRGWVEQPEPDALLRAEVFLDVRPVHGELSVDVLDRILIAGGSSGQFLAQMARAAVKFSPPLGIFGRLRVKESIDVKRACIAAIVLLARLYGLAGGSTARTTVARLEAAAAAGTLSREGAGNLAEAYRFLTAMRLRHQVDQIRAGEAPDNVIRLDGVTVEDRRRLVESMRLVREVQAFTAMRFATHTVT